MHWFWRKENNLFWTKSSSSNFSKSATITVWSRSSNLFFSARQAFFLWLNPRSKTYFSDRAFWSKTNEFEIHIRNKTVTKFQKLQLILTHLNFWKHVSPYLPNYMFNFLQKVPFGNPTLSERGSIAKSLRLSLASVFWWFWLFSVITTIFSRNYKSDLYHWDFNKRQTSGEYFLLKESLFCSHNQNPDIPKHRMSSR